MGIDVHKLLDRAEEMREACRLETGNPGLELGLELGEGPDKVLVEGDFGLWVEQLLAESTGKQGKGLIPVRYGDTADVQRPDFRVDDPYEVGAGVLPLGVRDRGRRLDPRDQPVRPARRPGGEGQDQRAALARRRAVGRARGRPRRAARAARARATTSRSSRSSIPRARESSRRSSSARARRGAPSPSGSARATSTPRASCTRAGRTPVSSSRSSTTSARSCRSPGKPFGFRTLIAAQAAGDFEALKERGRRIVRVSL